MYQSISCYFFPHLHSVFSAQTFCRPRWSEDIWSEGLVFAGQDEWPHSASLCGQDHLPVPSGLPHPLPPVRGDLTAARVAPGLRYQWQQITGPPTHHSCTPIHWVLHTNQWSTGMHLTVNHECFVGKYFQIAWLVQKLNTWKHAHY